LGGLTPAPDHYSVLPFFLSFYNNYTTFRRQSQVKNEKFFKKIF